MNDRSQGGSVIENGRVELMQNRRLNLDDWRGMGEPLQETNLLGVGISVPATYYVQLFNLEKRQSLQRTVQQRQDQPDQQFYSFDTSFTDSVANKIVSEGIVLGDFTSEMKLEL